MEQVERIRTRLSQALHRGKVPRFTASFGIADSTMSRRLDYLITLADVALYQAKTEGRDRACVADPSAQDEAPIVRRTEGAESEPAELFGAVGD